MDKINLALPELIKNLSSNSWLDAAKAIMTTDTIPKAVSKEIVFGDTVVTITGIVKGSRDDTTRYGYHAGIYCNGCEY